MTKRRLFKPSGLLSLVVILILVSVSELIPARGLFGQSNTYVVTQLSNDDPTQVPSKLNNLGDIVGRKTGNGGVLGATLWGHSHGNTKHLDTLPDADYSAATGINDVGDVTGVSNTGTALVPFVWNEKKGLERLPLLTGDNCGQAVAINKQGDVACDSSGPNGARAVLWTRKTGPHDLGVLPGGAYSRAHDVNDSDEVAGISNTPEGDRAVLWTRDGAIHDLGTLPGDLTSEALAINNGGDVVGYSKGGDGVHAFRWSRSNGMEALGTLPGGNSSRAFALNKSGVIVGTSTSPSGDHAFVWTKETGMMDLNNASSASLGIVLYEAHSINDKGQIISMGGPITSIGHEACAPAPPGAFLLTPTLSK